MRLRVLRRDSHRANLARGTGGPLGGAIQGVDDGPCVSGAEIDGAGGLYRRAFAGLEQTIDHALAIGVSGDPGPARGANLQA